MEKMQYSIFRRDTQNASGKAKWDAADILLELGFSELYRPSRYRVVRVIQQLVYTITLGNDVMLAIQYPANKKFFYRILSKKNNRSFALIHDIESLRMQSDLANDVEVLNSFDCIISHNSNMTGALRSGGYAGDVVELGLFDYLGFEGVVSEERDRSVVSFAGNLAKAGFLAKIAETGLKLNLFGVPEPASDMVGDDVRFIGSYPSNVVPGMISGGWGLVWDGDSTKTCSGLTGNYLRYNCPHKASMYIVAERPLIVWKESGIARYVQKKRLGLVVSSLAEAADTIGTIGDEDYEQFLCSVKKEKRDLCEGKHLKTAVANVIQRIA